MKKIFYTFLLISPLLFISSCKKDIEGCMDSSAINYNPEATLNDNSCLFDSDGDGIYDSDEILGCTDSLACNFNINATDDDNLCVFQEEGYDCDGNCVDELACNFGLPEQCQYPELGYDCEGNFTEYVVGMEAEGGIVFYVDETGEHGLVSALEDLTGDISASGAYSWGCYGMDIPGADGEVIGTGNQNTLDIVAGCSGGSPAASEALDAEINGYSDWYLPSIDELIEMYNTIGNGGPDGNIGGFENSSNRYWSSSEYSTSHAWTVHFYNGLSNSNDKGNTERVRVIRSF